VNIGSALQTSAARLAAAHVPDARMDAALLVAFVTGRDRAFLIAHPESELSADEQAHLEGMVARRAAREPIQYIIGSQEFFGLEFRVTRDVLIPRPETELVVENAINALKVKDNATFCEIGIGSGCISVSILYNVPSATAVGVDISDEALTVARENAAKHGVERRLELMVSDVFENVPEKAFDLIVANPPYVPEHDLESLQVEVRDHEPIVALTAGTDGLSIMRRIVDGAPERLRAGGLLLMEIGFDQATRVREMFNVDHWSSLDVLPDLQGIPRMVVAQNRELPVR
jgi:release factor glutamine methyltransferase